MRQKIAVYGSLREGEYNYDRVRQLFGNRSINVLRKDIIVEGFDLFDLGPYPAISRGENNLTVEIISVDENAYSFIKSMELGAGYNEEHIKYKPYGNVIIYTYPKNSFNKERLVASGDWSKHLKS